MLLCLPTRLLFARVNSPSLPSQHNARHNNKTRKRSVLAAPHLPFYLALPRTTFSFRPTTTSLCISSHRKHSKIIHATHTRKIVTVCKHRHARNIFRFLPNQFVSSTLTSCRKSVSSRRSRSSTRLHHPPRATNQAWQLQSARPSKTSATLLHSPLPSGPDTMPNPPPPQTRRALDPAP
jgi:hypothetical protein